MAIGLILLPILLSGCADEERLTLSEYAEFCAAGIASASSLIEPDSVTWGELDALASESAATLRPVIPPAELSKFHRASLTALNFVAEVASDQDPDAVANPLVFGFEVIGIATQLRRSVDELSPETRRALNDAGCL